jgi:DNA (cytosine-5)-methyltransferase 1
MSRQTPQKSSTVEIRIDADLAEKLRSVCGAQGVTVSSVIRGLITEYCEAAPVVASVTKSGNRDGAVQDLKGLIKRGSGLLRVGEMYCGPGGIGLGAVEAAVTTERGEYRFSHSFATDYDPDTCQTYARNLRRHSPQVSVICQDIRELDIASLPVTDGLMFGFPCNDFSTVGETKGINGTFGPLYRYGVEYIARVNPLFFFAENVSGLQSANSGEAFELILNDLANAGKHGYVLTTHLYRFEE